MSNLSAQNSIAAIEKVLISGDLSSLNPDQKVSYHNKVCETLGLNPLTNPFAYIKLNGKEVLYAKRDATDQLRRVHKISVIITSREIKSDVYIVTAKAKDADGREDESTGAVFVGQIKGEALANAFMKAETKAKRRVTLSICGLGMLDETEVETIPQTQTPKDVSPKSPVDTKAILKEAMSVKKPETFENETIPPEVNGESNPDYVIQLGSLKGRKLKDVPVKELITFCEKLHEVVPKDEALRIRIDNFLHIVGLYLEETHFNKPKDIDDFIKD